ncbi:unnamed protein product [Coffea canephora]|uniref:DH200=94 genomic scaffold, scaffold_903 n=1 Tax=Coffea canephora TaxID=49390 RepID=A0A068VK98_COFCA|nr:unnamed protein product [Coffea canephora]
MAFSGRVLVILDEIWKEVDFKSLGIPVSEKIKVIVTSQSPCVCRNVGAKIVGVNALPEEEACYLFKAVAGISDDSVLSDVAKQFAEECKGIPLALVVVARGLRTNCKTLKSWELALGQLQKYTLREFEGEKDLVYSIVKWSYGNLESVEAKSLLLLCSLFPEDYSIPVEFLVRYGKGLELFNERDTLGDVRCRVDVLVNDLRSYQLLLDDSEREDHVKLHDVVGETCLKIASKGEHVFLVGNAEEEERHQLPDSFCPCTAISLTLEGSIRLFPFGEECPRLKLLRLVFQSGKVNLSKDAFVGRVKQFTQRIFAIVARPNVNEFSDIVPGLLFHIVGANYEISRRDLSREYQFRKSFELHFRPYRRGFEQALDPIVSSIVKRAENLTFEGMPCLRNLVSDLDEDGFINLRRLKLKGEVHQCLIESTTNLVARQLFENLVFMELKDVNLEEICHGNLPPRCFGQLQEMKLEHCHRIVTLFSQSTLKCLVKLQKLVVHRCRNLESIVMREEGVNEEVLELPLLKTIVMQELGLLCFDSKRETARAFLNQVHSLSQFLCLSF